MSDVASVEAFLYREAELLDTWKLREWAALFTEDGEYLIPAPDVPEGTPSTQLHLIYDDRHRLEERTIRLLKRTAHVEYPRSSTLRVVSNVQIKPSSDDSIHVRCNFVAYRSRAAKTDIFPGHSEYALVRYDDTYMIRRKRAVLHLDMLRPQNKLGIII